jgi:hypothetical protein
MTKEATEHQWQNTYARLRRWLLKNHPAIYKEYADWIGKNRPFALKFLDVGAFENLPNSVDDLPDAAKANSPQRGTARVYIVEDPHQGSHPD